MAMVREATHTARGPLTPTADDVDEERGDVAVHRCGPSDDYPFCDGARRETADDADDGPYGNGERRPVSVPLENGPESRG